VKAESGVEGRIEPRTGFVVGYAPSRRTRKGTKADDGPPTLKLRRSGEGLAQRRGGAEKEETQRRMGEWGRGGSEIGEECGSAGTLLISFYRDFGGMGVVRIAP